MISSIKTAGIEPALNVTSRLANIAWQSKEWQALKAHISRESCEGILLSVYLEIFRKGFQASTQAAKLWKAYWLLPRKLTGLHSVTTSGLPATFCICFMSIHQPHEASHPSPGAKPVPCKATPCAEIYHGVCSRLCGPTDSKLA